MRLAEVYGEISLVLCCRVDWLLVLGKELFLLVYGRRRTES